MIGPSTCPFTIVGGDWTTSTLDLHATAPSNSDTVVGNDVHIGRESTVMPGVHIGDGAILATHSVVTSDVPSYTIISGDPARVIKHGFTDDGLRDRAKGLRTPHETAAARR